MSEQCDFCGTMVAVPHAHVTDTYNLSACAAERDALAARVADLEKDAARYRWLKNIAEARDNADAAEMFEDEDYSVDLMIYEGDGTIVYESGFGTDAIDEAIDAARSHADSGSQE